MSVPKKPNVFRKGKFILMEPSARYIYIEQLKQRIADGYYNSDKILNSIADDLAPILNDMMAVD